MSVIIHDSKFNKRFVYTKGAPEKIAELCTNATQPQNLLEIVD